MRQLPFSCVPGPLSVTSRKSQRWVIELVGETTRRLTFAKARATKDLR